MKCLGSYLVALLVSCAVSQECLPDNERVDCHPDPNPSPERCLSRGCTWCLPTIPGRNTPDCFFPRNYGYNMVGEPVNTGHGFKVQLERSTTRSMFGGEVNELTLEVDFQSDYRLRVRITDDKPRWEVPIQINQPATNLSNNPLYDVRFIKEPVFSFKIIRRKTATVIFDSSLTGFVFSDQFIQMGWKLPSKNVYGIGENEQHTLRHSFDKRPLFSLWSIGHFPEGNANLYGVHPQYTVLEDDGNAHTVVIINSNAQEFEMHPYPGIVYKTIGGILDMYIFLGPTPEMTAQQYSEAVGRFPLPPYWSLGFQLCRHMYNTIDNLKSVVDRMIDSEIPYDVQYGDIDIMDRNLDFTVSPDRFSGLNDYVKELRSKGIKFVTIQDPCISTVEPAGTYRPFELGNEMDVWVKLADGNTPAKGRVWADGACYFPDYNKNATKEWWGMMIKEFYDKLLQFDGLWIDMNEPSNFEDGDIEEGCLENNLNKPPFYPRSMRVSTLYDDTLCPDHVDSLGRHYDTHTLYGWLQSEPTIEATKKAVGQRTFILSRSNFIGLSRWAAHWLGDNYSNWPNMYYSIIGVLQYNMFAIPFVGPDICGHQHDAPVELCQRWQELGAFYPFSRNHNAAGMKDQDPAAFDGQIINSTRKALLVRYTLLPYLYTLLARHEKWGDTVARPIWNVFPTDTEARGIDRQFFWGTGILITPVLDEGNVTVKGYFPDSRFYDYYTGEEVSARGNYIVLDAPLEHINVHVHGGNIIPTQEPAVNTELSRNNPFGLIVALDDNEEASGSFYFDDGISFDPMQTGNYFIAQMRLSQRVLNYMVHRDEYPDMNIKLVDTVRLLGILPSPSIILVNGRIHNDFVVLPSKEVLIKELNLPANKNFTMQFD